MKNALKELSRDLRAALAINHTTAIEAVLETMLHIPQISGNHKLEDYFVLDHLVPFGEMIARSTFPLEYLLDMLESKTMVFRVIGATALLIRWESGVHVPGDALQKVATDHRPEVRAVIAHYLRAFTADHAPAVLDLLQTWSKVDSTHLQLTVARTLPTVYPADAETVTNIFYQLSLLDDFELNRELAEGLNEIARQGHGKDVIERLLEWSIPESPNTWLICKVISTPWAAQYADQAEKTIQNLEGSRGKSDLTDFTYKKIQSHKDETKNT